MNRSMILAAIALGSMALLIAGCDTANVPGGQTPGNEISTFSKSYGGPLHDEARVVLEADDGGFMLFGSANGDDLHEDGGRFAADRGAPRGGDFWVQKLDASGNFELGRLIGGTALPPETDWLRARPTSDGGTVLVGSRAIRREVVLPGAGSIGVKVGRDMAIARLGPDQRVAWSVSFDTGAWPGFDYVAENGALAEAEDKALDVWPMEDGGFLVAGTSKAHLDDRDGGGFPRCHDEQINELIYGSRGRYPLLDACTEPVEDTFIDAFSIVVLRLNADGSLRWQRRITDNAFGIAHGNEDFRFGPLGPLIRGTHDGGAILARGAGLGTLVYRLETNGEVRWRTVLSESYLPAAVFQTDDPVDGGLRDRQRDDGFVVVGAHSRVAVGAAIHKLSAAGEVEWQAGHEGAGLHDVAQRCDYGRPVTCHYIAVGFENQPPSAETRALAMILEDDGSVRDEIRGPRGGGPITRLRIEPDNAVQLLGFHIGMAWRAQLYVFGDLEYQLTNIRYSVGWNDEPTAHDSVMTPAAEIREDGRVLRLSQYGSHLQHFADDTPAPFAQRLLLQSEAPLREVTDNDRLQAAVRIGPGRYIVAGSRVAGTRTDSSIVIARYDSDLSGDRIIWQRDLAAGAQGSVLAAAASADGGAVLSVALVGLDPQTEGEPQIGRLIQLDGFGNVSWQLSLGSRVAEELVLLPDGGFAALARPADGSSSEVWIVRVSSAGQASWARRVTMSGRTAPSAMSLAADGGVVLAGTTGSTLNLVHLGSDGSLVTATDVRLDMLTAGPDFDETRMRLTPAQATFEDLRIRQSADGGFVLAMTEANMIASVPRDSAVPTPFGQTNVLVLALDARFTPAWAHVYGARLDERVRDLRVRADGTIAIAGYSDSLGERREAWLLKLSGQGRIAGGCQALLHSFRIDASIAVSTTAAVSDVELPARPLAPLTSAELDLPSSAPREFATARQCQGDAGLPTGDPPPAQRLTVVQVGSQPGVVTSTPAGISCGTGLNLCAADFPRGTRVTLRAAIEGFNAWRTACDEGTGGTALDCVIQLDRDRTIEVDFGPSPPQLLELAFAVQGGGTVRADGGIDCQEGSGPEHCVHEYAAGAVVDVAAEAFNGQVFLGWRGEAGDGRCESFGAQPAIQITMDRNLRCIAQFGRADSRLVSITVFGEGRVFDEPDGAAIDCRAGGAQEGCQEIHTSTGILTLRAQPDAGRRFEGWGGDCAHHGVDPVIELLTSQSLQCSARFEPINGSAVLQVQISGGAADARVESSAPGIDCTMTAGSDCSEVYPLDTLVILRATPLAGFQSWQGCDEVVDTNFCHVTMSQARTVTATYAPATSALLTVELIDPAGTAMITSIPPGIACSSATGSDCSEPYSPGTRVVLRASRPNVAWTSCDRVVDVVDCVLEMGVSGRYVRALFP